ncbi:hypothetical protein [Enterococcus hirae]|uniref:hypothetical protein n=1 Tax=Enterococcus hirae TaxID=1354 RepID=UPI001369A8FE|nr:hypothetical protein [Enterococcus hirae]NAE18268.1 hypothetical protein [Enterococcus hirae]
MIKETCTCGAAVEVQSDRHGIDGDQSERRSIALWRRSHKHTPRTVDVRVPAIGDVIHPERMREAS